MTDRPILFSAPMVRALLAGRKTQTRRVLKPQPPAWAAHASCLFKATSLYQWSEAEQQPLRALQRWPSKDEGKRLPFAPGDRLWVREDYYQQGHWWQDESDLTKGGRPKWKFAAYNHEITFEPPRTFLKARSRANPGDILWYKRLGRFMPRRYSRLTPLVTDVRVQRLQDISEVDSRAEGIQMFGRFYGLPETDWDDACLSAREAFATLWQNINGPTAWAENPWVVAVSFDVVQANIDRLVA